MVSEAATRSHSSRTLRWRRSLLVSILFWHSKWKIYRGSLLTAWWVSHQMQSHHKATLPFWMNWSEKTSLTGLCSRCTWERKVSKAKCGLGAMTSNTSDWVCSLKSGNTRLTAWQTTSWEKPSSGSLWARFSTGHSTFSKWRLEVIRWCSFLSLSSMQSWAALSLTRSYHRPTTHNLCKPWLLTGNALRLTGWSNASVQTNTMRLFHRFL